MKTHLIEYDEKRVYCKASSPFIQSTNNVEKVDCRVCKAMIDIEEGKISEIPFGGSYDGNGKPRSNVNGDRWPEVFENKDGLVFNILYEDSDGKRWRFHRRKKKRSFIREDGKTCSHTHVYNNYFFIGKLKDKE